MGPSPRHKFFGKRATAEAGDTRGWQMGAARKSLAAIDWAESIIPINYRLFDRRVIAYSAHVVDWGRQNLMRHLLDGANIALVTCRQGVGALWENVFLSDTLGDDSYLSNRSRERGYFFPLYLLSDQLGRQTNVFEQQRTLNLDPKLYAAICAAAGIDPADQVGPDDDFRGPTGEARPSEVKLFDYVYGVLHSPAYREKFAEFLKIDFPRIPYPPSPEVFRQVSEKGEQLRRLHLMEPAAIGETPYPYEGEGDDLVASGFPKWEEEKGRPSTSSGRTGRVLINKDQYFAEVSKIAWEFHIGGYQPAQKWLKDRRGRTLNWDDISHYQRIVKILAETDRIMKEIELPLD